MSTVSVSLEDVVLLLDNNFTCGTSYKYAQISDFLEEKFLGINKNQIAGLISRMGTTQIFRKEKSSIGKRYDYVYQGVASTTNSLEGSIKENVIQKLNETITDLNKMKATITDVDDFSLLQKQIEALKAQIENI